MTSVDKARKARLVSTLVLIAIPVFILSGCVHNESNPISFYRLTADIGIKSKQPKLNLNKIENPMIGLGPIHIPEYLD